MATIHKCYYWKNSWWLLCLCAILLNYCQETPKLNAEHSKILNSAASIRLAALFNQGIASLPDEAQALKFNDSLRLLSKAIGSNIFYARSLYLEGLIYQSNGSFSEAINTYKRYLDFSKKNGLKKEEAVANEKIGFMFNLQGMHQKAIGYFKNQLALTKELKDSILAAIAYFRLGNAYLSLGDPELALDSHKTGLNQLTSRDTFTQGVLYEAIGTAYRQLDSTEQARSFYEQALNKYNISSKKRKKALIALLIDYADFCLSITDITQAKKLVKRSFEEGGENHFSCLLVSGKIPSFEGHHDKSIYKLTQTLSFLEDSLQRSQDSSLLELKCLFLSEIGSCWQKQREIQTALAFQQKALAVASTVSAEAILENPGFEKVLYVEPCLSILEKKARLFQELYLQSTNKTYLQNALITFESYFDLVDDLRSKTYSEKSKINMGRKALPAYEQAIKLCLLLESLTGDQTYSDKAFDFSERSKAGVLLDLVEESVILRTNKTSDSLALRAINLKKQISDLNNGRDKGNAAKSLILKQEYQHLVAQLRRSSPVKNSNSTIASPKINLSKQTILDSSECLVEYFWGDTTVFIFAFSRDQRKVFSFPRTAKFDEALDLFQKITERPGKSEAPFIQSFVSMGYLLYETLLAPVAEVIAGKQKIIIIPDGRLHYLPFEALLMNESGINFKELSYLVKDYVIAYAHSIALLQEFYNTQAQVKGVGAAGFAPEFQKEKQEMSYPMHQQSTPERSEGYVPIPGASEEVKYLGKLFNARTFTGKHVTESLFRSKAAKFNLLVLATHADLNDQSSSKSRLVFSNIGNPGDLHNDGMLEVWELYDMELRASLTVLSSCKTGLGKIEKGEGVISLSRAFFIAGCSGVAMSLWEMNDDANSAVMKNFYSGLKTGLPKDKALQKAKLHYLKNVTDSDPAHPYYWAGMIVIGNMEPVQSLEKFDWFWVVGIGVIAVGLWFWLKRRNSFE